MNSGRAEVYARLSRIFATAAAAPSHETEYGDGPALRTPHVIADIAGFYRAFGLAPGAERPDHIAVELEFMAFLAAREEASGGEEAVICREAAAGFLRDHLGRWAGAYAAARGGDDSAFLASWIGEELLRHGIDPMPQLAPNAVVDDPAAGTCASCSISGGRA